MKLIENKGKIKLKKYQALFYYLPIELNNASLFLL